MTGISARAFLTILCFLFLGSGIAHSGTIKGIAVYKGKILAPPPSKTGKYQNVCGPEVQNESIIISKDGLENVVITLTGIKSKGKPTSLVIDQKKCRYEPHVLAMHKDSELKIRTSDPINHNIHTYAFDNDPINLMFTPGQENTYRFDSPEVIKIECDLHSWMTSWLVVVDNAHFAISKEGGAFEIADVPPGTYTVNAWHEVFGNKTETVTVGDGASEINFDFSKAMPQAQQKNQ
jgi:hypothetical protein